MKKDLFIPLKTEYYNQFVSGEKNCELRLEGPRWNERTCFQGRGVVVSKGYGKAHRMKGVVIETYIIEDCALDDFVKLYGEGKNCRVIKIWIPRHIRELNQKELNKHGVM